MSCEDSPTTKAQGVVKVDALDLELDGPTEISPKWDNDSEFEFDYDEEVILAGVKHHVHTHEVDEQVSKGGHERLTATDTTSNNTSTYAFDPSNTSITISVDSERSVIVQNPDLSYSVDGVAAADGRAAFALLKAKPFYAAISAHALLAAYDAAQQPAPNLTRIAPQCANQLASPPAVCVVMRSFCDCVACDKAGKTPCSLCP